MESGVRQIWVLLLAVALLSVGHGLHGSLIGVRASAEGFSTPVTGIIMSGYSAGLLMSAWATPRIVRSVGHIRVFAGFASVVSTAILLVPLWVDPVWWTLMRFVAGFCTSGLFIVCESWLNAASTNQTRGKLLSIYMIVTYAAIGAGQLLLNVSDSSGFSRFILVSALMSLALVPLSLVPTETPSLLGSRGVGVAEIFRASPLAVIATFLSGLGQSALFAMGAVFGLMQGLSLPYVSIMMALPPLAIILSQYPAGVLSDRYDRRSVIMVMAAASAVIAAASIAAAQVSTLSLLALMALFGAASLPVYSLIVAHANDHLDKTQTLGAAGKLVMLYGMGSIAGPVLVGQFMHFLGAPGFMAYMVLIYGLMAGMALWRRYLMPETVKAKAADAMQAGPLTTPVSAQARAEDASKAPPNPSSP
jgi:MFS family permease